METIRYFVLIIHIISGFSALVSGLGAILSAKGQKVHRFSGRFFFISMLGVSISALVISGMTRNYFLLVIGVFSFFQNYFGFRAVQNKSLKASWFDWVILIFASVNSILMLISMNIVLIVFGVISSNLAFGQSRIFYKQILKKEIPKNQWLIQHIGMMLGAYIATLTAFLVVNISDFEPGWLIWIGPTVVGGPLIFYYTRKTMRQSSRRSFTKIIVPVILFAAFYFSSAGVNAQPYIDGGNTRHRFAQLTVGLETRNFFSAGSTSYRYNAAGLPESFDLGNQTESRIIIGGTHFWGHADFYLSIPFMNFSKSNFSANVETGARYFPWRIENNKIRPYAGAALLPVSFKQDDGTSQMRFRYPVTAGFLFNHNRHLLEFGAGYFWSNQSQYYINQLTPVTAQSQSFWLSLSYRFMIETTLSAERDWQNGKTQKLTDTLAARNKLNGFTISAGPSTAFFMRKSEHNENELAFLDNHKASNIFADLGLGYYFHKPDLQINLAWRSVKSELTAYGFEQKASRKSLALEVFKFICDYHGFSAFVGPAISYEWLRLQENSEAGIQTNHYSQGIKPGITFGWDIRPNRIQQIVLRTNLRYFPLMNMTLSDGKKFAFDQLEFNFIQVVIYPNRIF